MSFTNSSNFQKKLKNFHEEFSLRVKSMMSKAEELKDYLDIIFLDFGEENIEIEARLNDVLEEKTKITSEYEALKRKEKDPCDKCVQMQRKLEKESRKLKQYEFKMKNIANLLSTNTIANTCEGNAFNLMTDFVSDERSQNDKEGSQNDEKSFDNEETTCNALADEKYKEAMEIEKKESNDVETPSVRVRSRILVDEKEDDEYFETSIKRKTPEDEIVLEIPETICEDYSISNHNAKRPLSEESPTIQTPTKRKRNLSPNLIEIKHNNSSEHVTSAKDYLEPVMNISQSPSILGSIKVKTSNFSFQEKPIKNSRNDVPVDNKQEMSSKLHYGSGVKANTGKTNEINNRTKNVDKDETRFVFDVQKDKNNKTLNNFDGNGSDKKNLKEKWKNIFESSDDDDFEEINKKKENSFLKPDNNQWKLKVLNSSINKSKLKQTKLTVEKKVETIDISEIEGFAEGINTSDKMRKNNEDIKDYQKRRVIDISEMKGFTEGINIRKSSEDSKDNQKKLIIEETQLDSQDNEIEENNDKTRPSPDNCDKSSLTQISLPGNESLFVPNAVSTQKITKPSSEEKIETFIITKSSRRTTHNVKNANDVSSVKQFTTPTNPFKNPAILKSNSSNMRESSIASSSRSRGNTTGTTLFLPKNDKNSKKDIDYTSKWTCPGCLDYFISSYGSDILKLRPPPKKCGHKNKYPSTPPGFWDPMCS